MPTPSSAPTTAAITLLSMVPPKRGWGWHSTAAGNGPDFPCGTVSTPSRVRPLLLKLMAVWRMALYLHTLRQIRQRHHCPEVASGRMGSLSTYLGNGEHLMRTIDLRSDTVTHPYAGDAAGHGGGGGGRRRFRRRPHRQPAGGHRRGTFGQGGPPSSYPAGRWPTWRQ